MRTAADDDRIEQCLRERLGEGDSLEDAIRHVHIHRRVGAFWIYPMVERITGMPRTESMRTVVRAMMPLRHPD